MSTVHGAGGGINGAWPGRVQLGSSIRQFIRGASLEITVEEAGDIPALARVLEHGTAVHVVHGSATRLESVARVALALREAGLSPCPHVAVRRVESEAALRRFLGSLQAGGVDSILLTAGDVVDPGGPYLSAMDVLRSGTTVDHGIERIGVVGHPEGSRLVAEDEIWRTLDRKQAFADRTGTSLFLVSQFALNPGAVPAWECELRARGITLPVHVGVPGPRSLPHLMHHALQCGVEHADLGLLRVTQASAAAVGVTTPDQVLTGLVRQLRAQRETRVLKAHFLSCGSALDVATWLRAATEGALGVVPSEWGSAAAPNGAPRAGTS